MDTQVVEQLRKQVKPAAEMAGKATDEVFRKVVAIARGIDISFEAHPKRRKMIDSVEVGIPALLGGIFLGGMFFGRRRAEH